MLLTRRGAGGRDGRAGAHVARDVQQAARRVYGRRVDHLLPAPTSADRGRSGPHERENHQDHQAKRDTGDRYINAKADDAAIRMPGKEPHARAHDHQDHAEQHGHGARYRQDDDYPYPPDGDGIGAHCSTIAPWLTARKPYEQARLLRL
jgi:hypothetical protein